MQFMRRLFGSSSSETTSNRERRRGEVQGRADGTAGSTMTDGVGAATSVSLELDTLDCTVCWQPLHPPIFQCAVGHLVCSSCLAKLPSTKKCCLCSRKGDYNRCYAMEKVLGSMQVPCSNAKYGCTAKTSYYQRQGHEAACPVGLCYCPGSGCGFSERSTGALLAHFVTAHGCPSTKFRYGVYFDIAVGAREHVLVGDDEHLFLLVMASLEPSGSRAVSVFCVRPRDAEPRFRCRLSFGSWKDSCQHTQSSSFQVPSTALADGIPRDCSVFILPKLYLTEDSKISVTINKILAREKPERWIKLADLSGRM